MYHKGRAIYARAGRRRRRNLAGRQVPAKSREAKPIKPRVDVLSHGSTCVQCKRQAPCREGRWVGSPLREGDAAICSHRKGRNPRAGQPVDQLYIAYSYTLSERRFISACNSSLGTRYHCLRSSEAAVPPRCGMCLCAPVILTRCPSGPYYKV